MSVRDEAGVGGTQLRVNPDAEEVRDAGVPQVRLARDGRDPARVPANWRDYLDPAEWRLGEEGLPFRRAARVIAVREEPQPGIVLVSGHDWADSSHAWAFTPGGGIRPGESPRQAAVRELAEETGWRVAQADLVGPVLRRSALFRFNLVTCRQEEEFFLLPPACLPDGAEITTSGWTDDERRVLDGMRWWDLDEVRGGVAAGLTVYPSILPGLARELLGGWDGRCRTLRED